MRTAQVVHSWNRVTKDWAGRTGFTSLSTIRGNGFTESTVAVNGGALILAGVNSGGKSRLLRSIWAEVHSPHDAFTRLEWAGSPPQQLLYVDAFELLTRQWASLRAEDLVEQVEAAGLTEVGSSDLRALSYVIGRKYSAIRMAELESPDLGATGQASPQEHFREQEVPYFEVTAGGRTYGSRDLSRGELSILTLYWVLRSVPKGAVLLLDEPDLMLSPLSAQRALEFVIDHTNQRKVPVIFSTHSYLGLANAPRSSQVLLRIAISGDSSLAAPDDLDLWRALRVTAPKKLAFVVEDVMAKLLLGEFLGLITYRHLDVSEIWIGGSSAEVRSIGKLPNMAGAGMRLWGVLDGNEPTPTEQHCLKLPGRWSPEEGALEICLSYPELVTDSTEQMDITLENTVGDNPHDRVHAVADALGMSGESLVRHAWRAWATMTEEGQSELAAFKIVLEAVSPAVDGSR